MYKNLFSPLELDGLTLKNRVTMAPLYLGYAGEGGTVSRLILEHYQLMAESGAALIVVENATVAHPEGSGSNRTLRADTDDNLSGLKELAKTIKEQGALASLQINHAGRFAMIEEPLAPSRVETFGRMPEELTPEKMEEIKNNFAAAAKRVKDAGFDMVELHGGTGYLLAQFVSPRTNRRQDGHGGQLADRMKYPLEVVAAVKDAVGDFPVGYRFLADEWLPDGLKLEESTVFARELAGAGVAYLSVMGGTYESFFIPEIWEASKKEGYMVHLAGAVKKEVDVPVITAGRIATGELAESILAGGKADLIGLARVLRTDPEWVKKVKEGREEDIVHCDSCGTCMKMVMEGKPSFCVQWPVSEQKRWKAKYV